MSEIVRGHWVVDPKTGELHQEEKPPEAPATLIQALVAAQQESVVKR